MKYFIHLNIISKKICAIRSEEYFYKKCVAHKDVRVADIDKNMYEFIRKISQGTMAVIEI